MISTANINRVTGLNSILPSPTRHRYCCSSVWWQLHLQMEAVSVCSDGVVVGLEVPTHTDFAVQADILRIRRGDVATRYGCDVDTLPARLRR
jgi:hypothetical protein